MGRLYGYQPGRIFEIGGRFEYPLNGSIIDFQVFDGSRVLYMTSDHKIYVDATCVARADGSSEIPFIVMPRTLARVPLAPTLLPIPVAVLITILCALFAGAMTALQKHFRHRRHVLQHGSVLEAYAL